jgi:lipopolysaccharide transport protein LptA
MNSSYSQTPEKKNKSKTSVKKVEPKLPVKITADHMRYNENKSVVYFTGNVLADDTSMKVNSDIMTVKLDDKSSPTLIICEKNAIVRKENSISYSERAEYFLPKEKIVLSGKPKVVRTNAQGQKEIMLGKIITFYKNTSIITVEDPIIEFPSSEKKKKFTDKKVDTSKDTDKKVNQVASAKMPIKISAKDMHYDEVKGIVKFKGNVHVDDGAMKVDSDFMTITLNKNHEPMLIICENNVVIKKDNSTSYSDRAEYFMPDEKIILTGNPKVITINAQGKEETVKGRKITFYKNTNVVDVQGAATLEFPNKQDNQQKNETPEKR